MRVAIKGWDESSFQAITGADPGYFEHPLFGLKKALEEGLNTWTAVIWEKFGDAGVAKLKDRLLRMVIDTDVEIETWERYSYVPENVNRRGIRLP
jgi:uncharacterized Fe-S cluster-containing radical SAM superfamily protein